MIRHSWKLFGFLGLFLMLSVPMMGQRPVVQTQTDESGVLEDTAPANPQHLIRHSAVLDQGSGLPHLGVAGITFSLYSEPSGGAALWMETQNVQVDEQGHYSALLGETKAEGIPAELFSSGKPRWLGIQIAGYGQETRVPLSSVPYAVQADDAQKLGGRSAADYVLAEQVQQQVRNELQSAGFEITEPGNLSADFTRMATQPNPSAPSNKTDCTNVASNANVITNEILYCQIQKVLAILNEPDPVFSFQLCTEPAGNFEVAAKSNMVLKGNVTGSLGAKFAGNGGLVSLHANPEGGVDTGFKFAWDLLKLGVCADLRAAIQHLKTSSSDGGGGTQFLKASLADDNSAALETNLLDQVANLDEDALLAKMLGTANSLQFDPVKLQNLLDRIQGLSFDGGPLSILQSNADRAALMDALPMPPAVRTVLSNPASLLTKFKDLLDSGICNLGSQAPALDPLLGPICELAANEPFAKLLHRVDDVTDNIDTVTGQIRTTVNTVNSRVNTINNKVQDILDQLPVDGNCKLFC